MQVRAIRAAASQPLPAKEAGASSGARGRPLRSRRARAAAPPVAKPREGRRGKGALPPQNQRALLRRARLRPLIFFTTQTLQKTHYALPESDAIRKLLKRSDVTGRNGKHGASKTHVGRASRSRRSHQLQRLFDRRSQKGPSLHQTFFTNFCARQL